MKKNSFTLLELILIIVLLSITYSFFKLKTIDTNKLNEVTNRLEIQLKYLRYKALTDSKKNHDESKWYKKRWTIKFLKCRKSIGGIYYVMYSDKNKLGHPNKEESLRDPLSKKYIYNSNACLEKDDLSKYTLLTKNYNIKNIDISCNNTSSLGQLSFDYNGNIYTNLSNNEDTNKLIDNCTLVLIDQNMNKRKIEIQNKTSYIKIRETEIQ